MILDNGICTVCRMADAAGPGEMPRKAYAFVCRRWYGELSFKTTPTRPSDGREELRVDTRIRILQHRTVRPGDIVVMADIGEFAHLEEDELIRKAGGAPVYRITDAYHGKDDGSPAEITDLYLEVTEP